MGSIEISDYLDLIVRPKDLDEFLAGLLRFLTRPQVGEWQALDLYNLIDTSPTLAGLERATADVGWGCLSKNCSIRLTFPAGDWETYLAGIDKKQRHEIRRKIRRAEESGEVRWYSRAIRRSWKAISGLCGDDATDPEKAAFFAGRTPCWIRWSRSRAALSSTIVWCWLFWRATGKKLRLPVFRLSQPHLGLQLRVDSSKLELSRGGCCWATCCSGPTSRNAASLTSCGGTKL